MKKLFLALLLASSLVVGCKTTPQTTAGKLLASTAMTVDSTMKGWATYVAANHVPDEKQKSVKDAYQKYQLAMSVAAISYGTMANGTNNWESASKALTASSTALTTLITSFTITP